MRQVLLSKSGRILVEEAPAPEVAAGEVGIAVAYSLISTGTETSAVAAPERDLRERVAKAAKLARMGIERLREGSLEETLLSGDNYFCRSCCLTKASYQGSSSRSHPRIRPNVSLQRGSRRPP